LYLKSDLRTYVFGLKRDSHFRKENINTQMFASFFCQFIILSMRQKTKWLLIQANCSLLFRQMSIYRSICHSFPSFITFARHQCVSLQWETKCVRIGNAYPKASHLIQ